MVNRADEIRKRIARRKKLNTAQTSNTSGGMLLPTDEERYGGERLSTYESPPPSQGGHPLFNKEVFILKILGAGIMVLLTAIMYKNPSPIFQDARAYVEKTMESEFQFAAVSTWYEDQFGKPLALLPLSGEKSKQSESVNKDYALPASARVVENFKSNGKGIMIETNKGETVDAMKGGLIIFAGKKDDLGNTVVIQHDDKTESWYGHLESVDVKQYEKVKSGVKVGTVKGNDSGKTGEFYFAIKKGDTFIDPIQVISFE
ncbi:peptidoglycan DD-metalloendopeptidase family protein [Rossellomorea sp. BNER]|uniref:peptidoglycan DD-metalloendopeptidase family protein n=1 Tax=Rossellomorea sp. BNER TaxID=2962031 RepID=UPI003AF29F0A|nr:M23 family metallopeptidase [Rossellomorea sp. BNER]